MKKPNLTILKLDETLTRLFCNIVDYIGAFIRKIGHPGRNDSFLFRVLFGLFIMIPLWLVGTAIAICLNIILFIVRVITMPAILMYNINLVLGTKLREHLFKVMPKHPFEQGVQIQQPCSLWHKFLAKICTLAGINIDANAYIQYEIKVNGEYRVNPNGCCIRTIAKEHRIVLWHELAHCVEPTAQPKPWNPDVFNHWNKGARFEKRADLYAYRKAFRELSHEEAIKEMKIFIDALYQHGFEYEEAVPNDCIWRARLAERYVRRYYQQ